MPLDAIRTKPLSDRDILKDASGRRPDGEYLHTIAVYVRPWELTCVRLEARSSKVYDCHAPGNEERPQSFRPGWTPEASKLAENFRTGAIRKKWLDQTAGAGDP